MENSDWNSLLLGRLFQASLLLLLTPRVVLHALPSWILESLMAYHLTKPENAVNQVKSLASATCSLISSLQTLRRDAVYREHAGCRCQGVCEDELSLLRRADNPIIYDVES